MCSTAARQQEGHGFKQLEPVYVQFVLALQHTGDLSMSLSVTQLEKAPATLNWISREENKWLNGSEKYTTKTKFYKT